MANTVTCRRLRPRDVTDRLARDLHALTVQLTTKKTDGTSAWLYQVLADKNTFLYVATKNRERVATATLHAYRTLTGCHGRIDDVVTDSDHLRQGIGRRLMGLIIATARRQGCTHIDLTSNDARAAAHGLYLELGFEQIETNVFRLRL